MRVTVTGGGPVGLSFALLLEDLMGPRVAITVYDGRWTRAGEQVVWKTPDQGNVRRQQVVTVQSRQYLRLLTEVQERLFTPDAYCEMWPTGPDSIEGFGPRNIRIAYIEDQLLAIANDKPDQIQLIPEGFDPAHGTRTRSPRSTCSRSAKAAARARWNTSPTSSASETRRCTRSMASKCRTWFSACG